MEEETKNGLRGLFILLIVILFVLSVIRFVGTNDDRCKEAAMIDYKHKDLSCTYFLGDCTCVEYDCKKKSCIVKKEIYFKLK